MNIKMEGLNMIKEAINALVNGKDLTDEVMTQVMEESIIAYCSFDKR